MKLKQSLILPLFISIFLLSGCAATKVAVYQIPGFEPTKVDVITILPVADLRIDKNDKVKIDDVNSWMMPSLERTLKKAGYKVNVITDRSLVANLTEADLKSKDLEWLRQGVASGYSKWILIAGLNDVMSKLTFGSTGNAEVSGYFYDVAGGALVWHDKGVGKTGQGGLMGMAMKGMMSHDAVVYATANLIASFPKPPKK
jgi:hypothetical protein